MCVLARRSVRSFDACRAPLPPSRSTLSLRRRQRHTPRYPRSRRRSDLDRCTAVWDVLDVQGVPLVGRRSWNRRSKGDRTSRSPAARTSRIQDHSHDLSLDEEWELEPGGTQCHGGELDDEGEDAVDDARDRFARGCDGEERRSCEWDDSEHAGGSSDPPCSTSVPARPSSTSHRNLYVSPVTPPVLRVAVLMHLDDRTIVNDTLQGQIITSIVIVAFVFGFLLREWVLMNGPIAPIQPRELDPVQLEDVQRFVGAAIDEPPPPVGALRQGQQWGVHGTGFDGEDRIYEGEEDESWLYPLEEGGEEGSWDDEVEEAPSAGASGRAYLQDHQQATSDDEQDQGVGSSAGATRESPRRRRKDKARQDDRTQRRIARRARAAERNIRPLPRNAVAPSSSSSQSSTAANQSLDEEEQGRDQRWQAYHEDDGQADDDDDWDDVPALEAWLPQGIERRPDEPEVIVIELPPGLPAEREDDFQDVFDDLEGIMEAIGMRGSLFVLVQNMGESHLRQTTRLR
jgi:hypothetical protein